MAQEIINITGLESRHKELEAMLTSSPAMKRELTAAIKKIVSEARKRVVQDAKSALENDPREAFRAVRSSVYKQIFGGNLNILSPRHRGAATHYQRHRKLDENPHQRGGNRMKRSERTMQIESYHGKDRGFILRFNNAGANDRLSQYGNRGSLRARHWFGTSTTYQLETAANELVKVVDKMIDSEFKMI